MKKFIVSIIVLIFSFGFVFSQDAEPEKKKDKPVRAPFESGILIDNQTCVIPTAKTLEMLIQHRFGNMGDGIKNLWGIYKPGANIRIGFNYSILDNLMVGYGLTGKNMQSDFQLKWNILQQTRQNTIPVAVTLYGNMAIDGRKETVFGKEYKFSNRYSYFSQLIVGRKFCDWFSFQANVSYTHYNNVDSTLNASKPAKDSQNLHKSQDHDKIGVGFNGRIKFSPQSAFIFQYDIPLNIKSISEVKELIHPPKPNFGIGIEVSTSTHAFQFYITSADGILPQENYMYNQYDWTNGVTDLMFGFTITRLWSF